MKIKNSKNSLALLKGRYLILFVVLLLPLAVQAKAKPEVVVALPDFSVLAAENRHVVVNIRTTRMVTPRARSRGTTPFDNMPEEMLRHFFGLPRGHSLPREQQDQTPRRQANSLGSGFIISADGYIVTNHHVIKGADNILVKMSDRVELKATLVGTDPRSDIALLKVEADNLPFAKIGQSKNLKVGQWVLAIGSPFGLDFTVTHGIVSALGRSLPDDTYVPFIQTNVAINPGNSGGPLINMNGEVIGVNSQIYSKTGGSMGLSFSVPIDLAMHVVEQLKEKGKVERGFLGVQIQEVSAELARSFGMVRPKGALVAGLVKGGAAEEAGVKPGDIILKFDGKEIKRSASLPPIVGKTPLDRKVTMLVLRNGVEKTLRVKVKALSEAEETKISESTSTDNLLNAKVNNIDPKALEAAGVKFGVRIIKVEAGVAREAGLRAGDIIVTLNFKAVKSVEDLNKILEAAPKGQALPVRVVRNNRSLFLPLVLQQVEKSSQN